MEGGGNGSDPCSLLEARSNWSKLSHGRIGVVWLKDSKVVRKLKDRSNDKKVCFPMLNIQFGIWPWILLSERDKISNSRWERKKVGNSVKLHVSNTKSRSFGVLTLNVELMGNDRWTPPSWIWVRFLSFRNKSKSKSKSTLPLWLFLLSLRYSRFASLQIDCGIEPWNLLAKRSNRVSWVRFPTQGGIWPVSWFLKRNNKVSWVRFLRDVGMSPYKLASAKPKTMSFACLPSQDNFCGLKLILESPRWVSCVRLANEKGIFPENLLNERRKKMRLVRLPSELGTKPEKLQVLISNSCNDFRFPIESGSLPEKPVF